MVIHQHLSWGGACGEEIGEPCIYCIFYQVYFDFKRQMRITFVSTFRFRVRNLGPDLGGRFGTFVFCVFFVEYTLDCRDKYKYLKPLLAKWSRYYFTSLGGALTGGHTDDL